MVHPVIHPSCTVINLRQGVQFRTGELALTVRVPGALVSMLLAACDGNKTIERIRDEIAHFESPSMAAKLFDALLEKGLIVDNASLKPDIDAFEAHIENGGRATSRLEFVSRRMSEKFSRRSVVVIGSSGLSNEISSSLQKLGINALARDSLPAKIDEFDLVVAVAEHPAHEEFRAVNLALASCMVPSLYASICDERLHVGPLVFPGDSACFECFHRRLISNSLFEEEAEAFLGDSHASAKSSALYRSVMGFFVCSQVAKLFGGAWHVCLLDEILDFHLVTHQLETRPLQRLPRCPACGSGRDRPDSMIRSGW